MRNFFSGRGRYALMLFVVAGALVVGAAQCQPTKPPAPALSIAPTSWDFGTSNPKTFTVTNSGPSTSGTLDTDTSGTDAADFEVSAAGVDNTCQGQTLAAGDTCDVTVNFIGTGTGERQADLVVDDPDDGEAVAKLSGTPL